MRLLHRFGRIFESATELLKVPTDNPSLTVAQFEAFSKQVPLLYFIVATNMVSLAFTHRNVAPFWLVYTLPTIFTILCVLRAVSWVAGRRTRLTAEQARRRLYVTNWIAGPIALCFASWSVAMFSYGDAYQRAHTVFFMAITVVGVIFCLMHLRSAALIVTSVVIAPFVVSMALSGEPTFIATGINVILVAIALIVVLLTHYRDFHQLHESRQVLLLQQMAIEENINAAQALSDANLKLANLDSLTLLANRRSFFSMLGAAFQTAEKNQLRLAVGVLDLDGFKPVNDMYGHAAGDKVLAEMGRRLAVFETGTVSVFRLGGDEFALVIAGNPGEETVITLGEQICACLADSISIGNGGVQVTASIGFALYPDIGTSGQDLYERADYALYAAKRDQRGGIMLFNAMQAESLSRRRAVEQALFAANIEEELYLAFQPIIAVENTACIGFEALARWNSPVLGAVSPGEFIPIAEHSGRISLITRHLLKLALDEARNWPVGLFLSFNLSAHDLASSENVLRILALVLKSGFDPQRINFEITETAVTRDFNQAIESIHVLKQIGVEIALDDFGTGYSSLNHIHKLPLSKIKIDRSFISNISETSSGFKIVKSVFTLCQEMGLEAIAEGVETEDELMVLKLLGIKAVQGYYFSKPVGPLEARAFALRGEVSQQL